MEIIFVLIWIAVGAICYSMAEKRGRNKWIGFLAGLFFGIFGVIGYAIAGKTDKKRIEEIKEITDNLKKD